MTPYQEYIHKSRYARWIPELNRRETWEETIDRYVSFMVERSKELGYAMSEDESSSLRSGIVGMSVMPSMRALMTAGKALELDNVAGFNCSFIAIDNLKAFDEVMYILMCGTGVGFSVESRFVSKLPTIAEEFDHTDTTIVVADSKIGWASAFRELLSLLVAGKIPKWDVSKVRPAGARLKTFGGRASGPAPLVSLFEFSVDLFRKAAGRKLTTLEAHDLVCKVADIVVVGGVRRCLPDRAKVFTRFGVKNIADVVVGDEVLTARGFYPVTAKFDQGFQHLIKVKTQDSDFVCTPNHKIAVLNGMDTYVWKEAQYLEYGDRVIAPSVPIEGVTVSLPEFIYDKPKHSTTVKDIQVTELDNEMAWLLGMIQGDGYVRLTAKSGEISVSINKTELGIGSRVRTCLERFGVNTSVVDYDNYFVIRVKSKQLACYLHSWLKQPKTPLEIPSFMWEATADIKLSYVSGLMDSDGSKRTRPVTIVTSVYGRFVRDLQTLLSSCGVQTRVKTLSSSNLKDGWQQKYALVMINERTKAIFNQIPTLHKNDIKVSGTEQNTNSYPKEFLDFTYPNNYPWSKTDNKLIPVAVVDIEDVCIVDHTWDIEVAEANEFFCDGYLMHNSALISLSDLDDDRLRYAKSGQWWLDNGQRALANNSAVYDEKPDVNRFLEEWSALYMSKSGERGIFNREAAAKKWLENGRRSEDYIDSIGVNPCAEILLRPNEFCVAGDTPLITRSHGIQDISDLENNEVEVWNGEDWTNVTVRKTGTNQPLLRVTLSDGSYIDCTPDHRFSVKDRFSKTWHEVQARDLMSYSKYSLQVEPSNVVGFEEGLTTKNPYTLGFVVGDGCVYKETITCTLYGDKEIKCPIVGTRGQTKRKKGYNVDSCDVYISHNDLDPQLVSSLKQDADAIRGLANLRRSDILQFVAGLADADGSQVQSGGIRVYISDERRARALQLVLTRCGIRSSVNLMQKKGTTNNFGTRKKDIWYLQITECGEIPCHRLDTSKGHSARFKGKYQNVVSVEPVDGLHDTYCFNEPKKHKGLFGNVLTYQCNLSEVVIRANDTLESLLEKVRLATILGTLQSSLTDFRYLRKVWRQNCEEERLLGVSLTGIMDNPVTNGSKGQDKLIEWLTRMREEAIRTNVEWANKLGIEESVAITCVKPSGTVSQLVGSSSGIHPAYSKHYIRTVRSDIKDPVCKVLIEAGVPYEPDITKPDQVLVFSFPVAASKNAVIRDELTAIDQLELYKLYRTYWTEHNPSITVYVRESEWISVASWVYDNFDYVGGVSFLPYSDHVYKQAPYQPITEEEYVAAVNTFPTTIDWSKLELYEIEDSTDNVKELACVAGVCEI